MQAAALSRREREQLRHREEILLAAGAVFAEKGFHNATMEEIAQRSEFAIGSLYKHFPSKEAIFVALFSSTVSSYLDALDAVLDDTAPFDEVLERFLQVYVASAQSQQSFLRVFVASQRAMEWHTQTLRDCLDPVMERYVGIAKRLMSHGQAQGRVIPGDLEDLAGYFLAVLGSFIHMAVHRPDDVDFATKLPLLRELLLRGVEASPGRAGH